VVDVRDEVEYPGLLPRESLVVRNAWPPELLCRTVVLVRRTAVTLHPGRSTG